MDKLLLNCFDQIHKALSVNATSDNFGLALLCHHRHKSQAIHSIHQKCLNAKQESKYSVSLSSSKNDASHIGHAILHRHGQVITLRDFDNWSNFRYIQDAQPRLICALIVGKQWTW